MRIERIPDAPVDGSRDDRSTERRRSRPPIDVSTVDFGSVPAATSTKLERRLAEAASAFAAERFADAERLLGSIERLAPGVIEVMELRGLTQYRLGRWRRAIDDLQQFSDATGSVEQHPVLADSHRALGHWTRAEELWDELRDASPSAELVEEGRIVQSGTLADRGRLNDAIQLLERAPNAPKKPRVHHLRRWYALADLYERAGDLAKARRTFRRIVTADARFGDAAERLASLG